MSLLNPVFSTENVRYRDGKRYAWFVSLLVPAVLSMAAYQRFGTPMGCRPCRT